jgi:hypothetical protein
MDGVTPGIYTLKPGDEGYDDACAAALMACGVDPAGFGTYSSRLKAQGQLRKGYGDGHGSAAALKKMGPNDFLTANSESGHMCQNACFTKHRHDPCGNYPPTSGSANAPSAFGYSHDKAPATDHHGKSTVDGTTHGQISQVLDKQWPGKEGKPLTADQLKQSVKENAEVHVDANVNMKDGTKPTDPDVQRINNAQQANADRMKKEQQKAAAAAAAKSGKSPGSPASPSSGGPSKAIKNFAAECQVTKWEQGMEKMRKDAINSSPIAKSTAAKKALAEANDTTPKPSPKKKFTDLPQDKQKEIVAANQPPKGKQLTGDKPPKAPADKNINPPQESVPGKGPGKPPNTPTKTDCKDFQGNYLAWQMANGNGGTPPWGGKVPPGGSTPPAGSPATGSKKKKKK